MIRAAITLSSYLGFTWLLLVMFCIWPERALALVSPQAYARVVAQAEWIAYQAATKPAVVEAVASAASATSPASVAIRAVTGPIGWAALGVTVGLALYQTYYSDSKVAQLKEASRPSGGETITGATGGTFVVPSSAYNGQNAKFYGTIGSPCAGDGNSYDWMIGGFNVTFAGQAPQGLGSIRGGGGGWYVCHFAGSAGGHSPIPGPDPTPAQVSTNLSARPASDPLSIESNSSPLGSGGASPTPASNVQTVPVSPTDMPTTVKPASQVGPTDIKVADNVPPPAGTQVGSPATQATSTTSTTTTNPDGSVTKQDTETATPSCTIGNHDQRTLRTVYDQHSATWQNTGLLQAVNLLKTLTWPSTLPVVSLPSSFFGSQRIDFNDWAFVFIALRTLVIAIATLAAYRIVFVGGR